MGTPAVHVFPLLAHFLPPKAQGHPSKRGLMKPKLNIILALIILLYCLWNSADMFKSWVSAPYERFSWLFFLLWLLPLIYLWILKSTGKWAGGLPVNNFFLWAALIITLLGILGNINAVIYVGLAFSMASFMPWGPFLLIWLAGSISWMPAFGWIGSHYFPGFVFLFRLLIVIAATFVGFCHLKACKLK
jgi:hypothetical protein